MDSRCQTSLSFTISWSLLKLMSTESVMLSNHLILCHPFSSCPQSFPALGSLPMIQLLASSSQRIRASASASVLLVNIQGWFPFGLTDLISLQTKGLSGVFSNTTVQKHQFFSAQPSLWSNSYICTWPPAHKSIVNPALSRKCLLPYPGASGQRTEGWKQC